MIADNADEIFSQASRGSRYSKSYRIRQASTRKSHLTKSMLSEHKLRNHSKDYVDSVGRHLDRVVERIIGEKGMPYVSQKTLQNEEIEELAPVHTRSSKSQARGILIKK